MWTEQAALSPLQRLGPGQHPVTVTACLLAWTVAGLLLSFQPAGYAGRGRVVSWQLCKPLSSEDVAMNAQHTTRYVAYIGIVHMLHVLATMLMTAGGTLYLLAGAALLPLYLCGCRAAVHCAVMRRTGPEFAAVASPLVLSLAAFSLSWAQTTPTAGFIPCIVAGALLGAGAGGVRSSSPTYPQVRCTMLCYTAINTSVKIPSPPLPRVA